MHLSLRTAAAVLLPLLLQDAQAQSAAEAGTSVFDRDEESYKSSYSGSGRALQQDDHTIADHGGHSEHDYVKSTCNANSDTVTCINWSEYFDNSPVVGIQQQGNGTLEPLTDYLESEVKIPCGVCVTLDASPGDDLYNTTIEFGQGLNIVGKLVIPNDAKVHLHTKYVYVQGVLSMPEPPSGSSNGIPSETEGDRIEITLYGKDDLLFKADKETDNYHHGEKGVNNKAIVIAGGRLDIHAMDPTCPSWVKLQSIEYGTPLPNVALNKTALESSTLTHWQGQPTGHSASQAVDGNDQTSTHTKCNQGYNQWWQVDLEEMYSIHSMEIKNSNSMQHRLHDYDIILMDSNMTLVDSIYVAGPNGNRKTISTDFEVNARYVKIQLRDQDCLQLGEFKVYGYPASEDFPIDFWDKLTLGNDAARCWQTKGSRIMLTSDTHWWEDSHTTLVEGSPSPGVLAVHPLAKKKTAIDETFGYPDFAVEVALLDRKLVVKGEKETGDHERIGGHLIVLHTPMVKQHLEGAMFVNFGQQTRLGRYPLHFHMSECVHGSILAKNVIWKSNQRCIVVHGTHNLTLSENVAYDTRGHCFMLEDGGEWHNVFYRNLGALTKPPVGWNNPGGLIRPGESDHFPATFWITNPANDFIDNVAAGSRSTGMWFELKLRAPSSALAINEFSNPKTNPQGRFEGNAAHSNGFRAGITTYETGYHAPPGTTWKNIKSYKNSDGGLFFHGTSNINLEGGLLADNKEAARNFGNSFASYDGVTILGRSKHAQSMMDQGRLADDCKRAGGVSIQPNQGMGAGTTIKNSHFSGFDVCTEDQSVGNKNWPIWYENDQVRNGVVDSVHTIVNNTYGEENNRISACRAIFGSGDNDVRLVAQEDPDGSMAGVPGFYIQNHEAITNFIDESACRAEEGCLRFCPGICLRLGIVGISQDLTTRGYHMIVTDTGSGVTGTGIARGTIWFNELHNYMNAPMPFQLPAPLGKYQISFTDKNGDLAWPGYATNINFEKAPACSDALDESQVELVMPPSDAIRCDNLFHKDDFPQGIHGWQTFFAGIAVSQDETSSYVINTTRRKDDYNPACSLSRTLDASCFPGNDGRTYSLFGKIRIADAEGNWIATDGTDAKDPSTGFSTHASPRVSLILHGVKTWRWFVETSSDGTWTDWSVDVTLPEDTSEVWKATIHIEHAVKKEFHIKDWGMTLNPSERPTTTPTAAPIPLCTTDASCDYLVSSACTQGQCDVDTGVCSTAPKEGCEHGARLERWWNIGGTYGNALEHNSRYPFSPDVTEILGTSLQAPTNIGDNYGQRLQTLIVPPVTCDWNFYIASDDNSVLRLSTDNDPLNKVFVAGVWYWTSPKQWKKYASQKGTVSLVKGQEYYLEAIHKEGGGGDNLAIGWECIEHGIPLSVISAEFTSLPEIAAPTASPIPLCTTDASCDYLVSSACTQGQCDVDTGVCSTAPKEGCEHGARLERWWNIGGTYGNALEHNSRYPFSPDVTEILGTSLQAPTNIGDNYGQRLQTFITPPVTCDWNFYIASDDNSVLRLSTDNDPLNKVHVAGVWYWTYPKQWKKYASQKGTVSLVKGQEYYLEAIHKEGGGGDNLAIGWECIEHGISLNVIGAEYTRLPKITAQP